LFRSKRSQSYHRESERSEERYLKSEKEQSKKKRDRDQSLSAEAQRLKRDIDFANKPVIWVLGLTG
jgi:hypothetical protein